MPVGFFGQFCLSIRLELGWQAICMVPDYHLAHKCSLDQLQGFRDHTKYFLELYMPKVQCQTVIEKSCMWPNWRSSLIFSFSSMSCRGLESFGNLPTVIDGCSLGRKPVHPFAGPATSQNIQRSRGLQDPLPSSKGVTDVTLRKGRKMIGDRDGNTWLDREDTLVNGILPSNPCSKDN